MWDTVAESTSHLSHEMPCPWCRHNAHTFLPCSDRCDCTGWRALSLARSTTEGNRPVA